MGDEYSQISLSCNSNSGKEAGVIRTQVLDERHYIKTYRGSKRRSKGGFKIKQMGFAAITPVFLLLASTSFASYNQIGDLGTMTPTVAAVAFSGQNSMPRSYVSGRTRFSSAASLPAGLSLVDVIGVVLFLAFIVTHFCLCRKGVYPESSALCETPSWLKKLTEWRKRKAST